MRFLNILLFSFLLIGCTKISNVTYNSKKDKKVSTQFYENEQCTYFAGPFEINKKLDIDKLKKDTIKKANENGLYGNDIINIKVKKGGYVNPFFSKYCITMSGNIIYNKDQ